MNDAAQPEPTEPYGFREYQQATPLTAIYPRERALEYLTLGLVGEAGELANKIKKVIRDRGGAMHLDTKAAMVGEMGDCLYYISELCNLIGVDMDEVARGNIHKLSERASRGTLRGDGDSR